MHNVFSTAFAVSDLSGWCVKLDGHLRIPACQISDILNYFPVVGINMAHVEWEQFQRHTACIWYDWHFKRNNLVLDRLSALILGAFSLLTHFFL